ncbi:MAG: PepSY domain-containing protein [Sulfuricurvum sp.]|uniref:PepSY domain-containing protein n=1 Tax=Sulfuricurvum sp. TaxID=2025608 RepID=UPI002604480E|nr:PepSY domain-containing protein [Sulfuricurvum sp.]MDD2829625.1 PepSY domain-containing protein [Sulfuricurvum sp.]MDD4950557.1 PepSY domain-containing protein [Sulfuricurvum sp.]
MKRIIFIYLTCLSLSLYGTMGSSVTIPTQEHMKYAFGNHRNHLVKSMKEHQYYKSMAPMNEEDIRKHLSNEGYGVRSIKLRDIASELVYQVYATDVTAKDIKLYVDPANGLILKMEPIQ